jgi:hypothetical protein
VLSAVSINNCKDLGCLADQLCRGLDDFVQARVPETGSHV